MALVPCSSCGHLISDKALRCPKCKQPTGNYNPPQEDAPRKPRTPPSLLAKKRSGSQAGVVIVIVLLVLAAVGGGVYYKKVYLPEKKDAEAPRYYSFANSLNMREAPHAESDVVEVLPYGTEFIEYDFACGDDSGWSRVKVCSTAQEGYVYSDYILDEHDFFLLNSIFADSESQDVINTTRCRRALLAYFIDKGYNGSMAGTDVEGGRWAVFCSKSPNSNYSNIYYGHVVNRDSKYEDFAVIIRDLEMDKKKLLLFTFDDEATPTLYYEEDATNKPLYIKSITKTWSGRVNVSYTSYRGPVISI